MKYLLPLVLLLLTGCAAGNSAFWNGFAQGLSGGGGGTSQAYKNQRAIDEMNRRNAEYFRRSDSYDMLRAQREQNRILRGY